MNFLSGTQNPHQVTKLSLMGLSYVVHLMGNHFWGLFIVASGDAATTRTTYYTTHAGQRRPAKNDVCSRADQAPEKE